MASQDISRTTTTETATVAASGTTSGAITAGGWAIFGMVMPATLTSTTCTFTVCDTKGGTYVPLYDSAGVIVATTVVGTSRYIDLPTALASAPFFKIVLGSSEGGARSIVICKKG